MRAAIVGVGCFLFLMVGQVTSVAVAQSCTVQVKDRQSGLTATELQRATSVITTGYRQACQQAGRRNFTAVVIVPTGTSGVAPGQLRRDPQDSLFMLMDRSTARAISVSDFSTFTALPEQSATTTTPPPAASACRIVPGQLLPPHPEDCQVEDLFGLIDNLVRWLLGLAGGVALVVFIWGAFQYFLVGGDETKIAEARTRMTYAIGGLMLVAGARLFVQLTCVFFSTSALCGG